MHTVVLEAPENLRFEERPEPSASGEDVVVRIRAIGICGTDVSIFGGKVPVDYPLVLGHEMVGTLEDPAPGLGPGTRQCRGRPQRVLRDLLPVPQRAGKRMR